MNIDRKGMFELVGVLGVILSLCFVGLEVRQANQIAIFETRAQLIAGGEELDRTIVENAAHVRLRAKLMQPGADLTLEERIEAAATARLHTSRWNFMNAAYESGFLPERVFQSYASGIPATIGTYPGLVPFMESNLTNGGLGPEFSALHAIIWQEIEKYK